MTAPASERGGYVRAAILARVMLRHERSFQSLDTITRGQAHAITLDLMTEATLAIGELEAYRDQLARAAALVGATHEERGAAVGLSRERARRKWPWNASAPE